MPLRQLDWGYISIRPGLFMFLKERKTGHLLAVVALNDLFNPYKKLLECRGQCGEEEQDPEHYPKANLVFLSDEELPQCWLDPHYRDMAVMKKPSTAAGVSTNAH